MLRRLIIAIISVIALGSITFGNAQPNIDWFRMFDSGSGEDFEDIYALSRGGYITCGRYYTEPEPSSETYSEILLVKYDGDGQVIWSRRYRDPNGVKTRPTSLIEADNGDIVVTGYRRQDVADAFILRTNSRGEVVWFNFYRRGFPTAIIELKEGDFLVSGRSDDAFIIRVTGGGDAVWDRNYAPNASVRETFNCLRQVGDHVVAGGNAVFEGEDGLTASIWALKLEIAEGEPVWSRTFEYDHSNDGVSMATDGQGSVVLLCMSIQNGSSHHPSSDLVALKVDSNGNESWHRRYNWDEEEGAEKPTCIQRAGNGDYIAVGYQVFPVQDNRPMRPMAVRLRPDGTVRWREFYNFRADDGFGIYNAFFSVAVGNDDSFIGAGYVFFEGEDQGKNGMIMKLVDVVGARVLTFAPHDTTLRVLPGASVQFMVRAINERGERPPMIWTLDNDTLSRDTSVIISFNDFDEYLVKCNLYDDAGSVEIRWHVTVTDFFISAYTPETLALYVGRGSSLDFSIDTVKYIGEVEPGYLWTVTNLNNGNAEAVGEDSSVTIPFPRSGNYTIEGRAYRWESSDAIVWNVAVSGSIQAYIPEADSLSVLPDSVVHFEVVPSAPEDESLSIQWLVGGEIVREGEVALDWAFSTVDNCRRYLVQCVVADSVEADSVAWVVEVRELGVGDNKEVGQAGTPVLLSVSPNPFNSMLTIQYATGGLETAVTRIAAYDVAGREVYSAVIAPLVTRIRNTPPTPPAIAGGEKAGATAIAGGNSQILVWDASAVPAGVYFVRLQAGQEAVTKKVVLMR